MMWKSVGNTVLIALSLIAISCIVSGETEPNDSLDSPELLVNGTISGELNMNETDEDKWEQDIFRLDMEENSITFFFLKKTDSANNAIRIDRFNSRKEPIYLYYDIVVEVPGETHSEKFLNVGTPDTMYLVVSGQGSYSMTLLSMDLDDPNEPVNGSYFPPRLKDGDEIEGRVYTLEYQGLSHEDTDDYILELGYEEDVRITIYRTDTGDGELKVTLTEQNSEETDPIERTLEGGEEAEIEYIGDYYYQKDLYLEISGEGEYELIVEVTDQGSIGPGILLGLTGGLMCFIVLLSFSPYIIALAVILTIFLYHRSKKKKQKALDEV
ncbi:MAG: hypothetical protein JXA22_03040 [Candidatus Thermoplasmatota archaeon]|nr:hypothetical protein [Candidatus Thermoplasmatota archaeon]